ncbi:unnamed protein product [Spodoptera exigua]|nr:unnamed protein product [Spodoptera exigua]
MHLEVPVFKRFCFCLPLRHGLIVWGYLRLVLSALTIVAVEQCFSSMLSQAKTEDGVKYTIYTVLLGVLLIFILADILMNIVFVIGGHRILDLILVVALISSFIEMLRMVQTRSYHVGNLVIISLIIVLGIADFILTLVFVIGGQKKNVKLLKTCYIYNLVLWVLLIILGVSVSIYSAYLMYEYNMSFLDHIFFILTDVFTYLSQTLVQGYFLLLLRSEIIKLENNSEFQFVNNAAESECRMNWAQDGVTSAQEEETQEIHKF